MTYRCGNCGCYDVFAGQSYCSESCERQREAELSQLRASRLETSKLILVKGGLMKKYDVLLFEVDEHGRPRIGSHKSLGSYSKKSEAEFARDRELAIRDSDKYTVMIRER